MSPAWPSPLQPPKRQPQRASPARRLPLLEHQVLYWWSLLLDRNAREGEASEGVLGASLLVKEMRRNAMTPSL